MRAAVHVGACALLLMASPVGTAGQDQRGQGEKPREKAPAATPAGALKVRKDFKAELLYSVPKDTQGSWVNLCVDPRGRLIVSDQYGPLYRITPPPLPGSGREAT